MSEKKCTAIVLAAGSGSRMKSGVAKQFMPLGGKPLLWYSLWAVEQSRIIDDCILVTGEADIDYVKEEIVAKYGFSKVYSVVPGGGERCLSVAKALQTLPDDERYIFIHDGARPFLTEKILEDTYAAVQKFHACVAAVPSKDTIKLADEEGFAAATPDRRMVWSIQTPQVFDGRLITEAYKKLLKLQKSLHNQGIVVTDDAGVVELFTDVKVKFVTASYANIKLTTPEDLPLAESLLPMWNEISLIPDLCKMNDKSICRADICG